jgi:hypothetical protein
LQRPSRCFGRTQRIRRSTSRASSPTTRAFFVPLRDANLFNQVFIDYGAVTWPGELDLAPDGMYETLKASPPNTKVKL